MKKALIIIMVAAIMTASLAGLASANTEEAASPYYLSVTGTIVAVEDLEEGFRVEIATPDADRESRAFLNITDRTVFPFEEELNVGDAVTAYYLANAPMILIYPPQYNAAVLVNGKPADQDVRVDRFFSMDGQDGLYLAQGGDLAFRVDENTEIILADGQDFSDGQFDGRRIIVIYGPSTRSIPAQTTAIKLIVLFEDAVTGPLPIDPDQGGTPIQTLPAPIFPPDENIDATGWPILVNGTSVNAPAVFQTDAGIIMVPLRATAQALGYDVNWDATLRSVRLGAAIHAWIGNTEVHVGRMAPQTLTTAPVLVDGTTFVPLDFFRVIGVNNAYAFEGQIVLDTVNEPME
ncbi:MAG: copper amine oxidase N-terminal domain-containing protein [Oscillospiraceae bacterium]|nr:copper amine oxidase N-terminal domain-containing protein [Oscillospiraceae bacterium]